jgi:hypothetical protein
MQAAGHRSQSGITAPELKGLEGSVMGTASTTLNQPLSLDRVTAGVWRVIAAAVLVIALTIAAFAIGRATARSGSTASPTVTHIQRTTTSQSFDGCRTGLPC